MTSTLARTQSHAGAGSTLLATAIGIALLAGPATLLAQQPTAKPQPDSAGMIQAFEMMSTQMGPMYQSMMEAMIEGTLKALEKPETVDRMAAFARRYFEALVKHGFTREEALQIVAGTKLIPPRPAQGN